MCGLRSESTQRRLLTVDTLTFADALKTALGMEAAEKNALHLKGMDAAVVQRVDARKPRPSATPSKEKKDCYRCGRNNHLHTQCPFKTSKCHYCGKLGHLASVCRTKQRVAKRESTKWVQIADESTPDSTESSARILQIGKGSLSSHPITVSVTINEQPLNMELDTGAAVSIISEQEHQRLFPSSSLRPSNTLLQTYTGDPMVVAGEMTAAVQYKTQSCTLPLVVVAGNGPALLGRDWLRHIHLDWKTIGLTSLSAGQAKVQSLLHQYPTVFSDKLGKMTSHQASLHVPPDAHPIFCKARPVPFSLRDAASAELNRLEGMGILEKVTHAEWAAPIVLVPKGDGSLRLCGDYKMTVNRSIEIEQYPLPKANELFSSLSGGQQFTKLDLAQAYQQLPLDEESQRFCCINTHQGLYRFTRLPFGVSSAPAIFQRVMDTILQGIPHVQCYIDDLLITGANEEEHIRNLDAVLKRLQSHGISLKQSKCSFLKDSVEYLGHVVNSTGLHTSPKKVEAVKEAPRPTNQTQLRSFLGLLQYYSKFIPHLSTMIGPLNALLSKDQPWRWSKDCERAFQDAKHALSSASVLVHYNPSLPLRLAADASSYGVGAVISHVCADGEEHPIAYASRTLTASEKNYSQLEKEALSLVFGVRKFHQYLFGRHFTLITDHKPLTTILGPTRGVPPLIAARLQRWALFLTAYTYKIEYRSTTAHANADCLSRLPLPSTSPSESTHSNVFVVRQIEALPVTAGQLRTATRSDPILSRVLQYSKRGWPVNIPDFLKPYHNRRDELTLEDDCIMWGARVIVPAKLRERVLEELHSAHMGIAKTKTLARSHVWWPKLDSAIEMMTKSCSKCQAVQSLLLHFTHGLGPLAHGKESILTMLDLSRTSIS